LKKKKISSKRKRKKSSKKKIHDSKKQKKKVKFKLKTANFEGVIGLLEDGKTQADSH